ncbi:MAG: BON domain-containing protein [Verrucomicrobiota bacterium]
MPRADEDIKKDVVDQLYWDDRVNAADIQVEVLDGNVRLIGTVPDYLGRAAATGDAWAVAGVLGVDNTLAVTFPAKFDVPDDADIRANAANILRWRPGLDITKIQVEVNAGIVTLKGNVDSYWKRNDAEWAVAGVVGVVDVINELSVVPTEDIVDEVIAQDVERALERNLLVEPDEVTVKVANNEVTLTGTVPTYAAHQAAESAAIYTPGVVDVMNCLTVAA